MSTRVVEMLAAQAVEPFLCDSCGEHIKRSGTPHPRIVLANVYTDGRWDRLDAFHPECYTAEGEPYGEPGPRGAA